MEFQEIIDKVKEIARVDYEYIDCKRWIYYNSMTGFIGEDYFHVYFHEHSITGKEIEIANSTDNPEFLKNFILGLPHEIKTYIGD